MKLESLVIVDQHATVNTTRTKHTQHTTRMRVALVAGLNPTSHDKRAKHTQHTTVFGAVCTRPGNVFTVAF